MPKDHVESVKVLVFGKGIGEPPLIPADYHAMVTCDKVHPIRVLSGSCAGFL